MNFHPLDSTSSKSIHQNSNLADNVDSSPELELFLDSQNRGKGTIEENHEPTSAFLRDANRSMSKDDPELLEALMKSAVEIENPPRAVSQFLFDEDQKFPEIPPEKDSQVNKEYDTTQITTRQYLNKNKQTALRERFGDHLVNNTLFELHERGIPRPSRAQVMNILIHRENGGDGHEYVKYLPYTGQDRKKKFIDRSAINSMPDNVPVKFYRTMSMDQAARILNGSSNLEGIGHVSDFAQSSDYFHFKEKDNVMLEFTVSDAKALFLQLGDTTIGAEGKANGGLIANKSETNGGYSLNLTSKTNNNFLALCSRVQVYSMSDESWPEPQKKGNRK